MSAEMLQWMAAAGLAVALGIVVVLLDNLLRGLANRYGTPQDNNRGRIGSRLPRALRGS